jgi:hypothetical protein
MTVDQATRRLEATAAAGQAEVFALVRPSESTVPEAHQGVYLYLDEMGVVKDLPENKRAARIARACGADVASPFHGTVYIGRVSMLPSPMRQASFTLADLDAGSKWLATAPEENAKYLQALKEANAKAVEVQVISQATHKLSSPPSTTVGDGPEDEQEASWVSLQAVRSTASAVAMSESAAVGLDAALAQAAATSLGSLWLQRKSEEAQPAHPVLSRERLEAMRSAANAHPNTVDVRRQRWWSVATAERWFASGGRELPAWWMPAEFTTNTTNEESDRSGEGMDMADCARLTALLCSEDARCFEVDSDGPVVRLAGAVDENKRLRALGECGDVRCSTFRLCAPRVRAGFAAMVVRRTIAQMSGSVEGVAPRAVRYVTLGCGQLLADFQILCGMKAAGLQIETIIAVDSQFADICVAESDCKQEGEEKEQGEGADVTLADMATRDPSGSTALAAVASGWRLSRRRLSRQSPSGRALDELASLMAPARLFALSSTESLVDACARDPQTFGDNTTLVQIDAADIRPPATLLAAGWALGDGGFAFRLANTATGGHDDAEEADEERTDADDGHGGMDVVVDGEVTCWPGGAWPIRDRDDAGENADVTAWLHRV